MTAEILSIGSELMAGRIADTNAAFLSDRLTRLGFRVTRHVAVDDARAEIIRALRSTAERAEVAVITGGIGPTPDDLTRQAFAEFCSVELVEHAEGRRRLNEFFAARNRKPSASNAIQARIPDGSEILPNSRGTASGFSLRHGRCCFFCLPGVPPEMKAMYRESVEPKLLDMCERAVVSKSVHVFGVGESIIGERLHEFMGEGRNPEVATQARQGIISIRITAAASDEAKATRLLEPVEREVRARMGSALFGSGEDTLPRVVAGLLKQRSKTVAIAESCTGGEISARLTDVPGISRFLVESAVTYSNDAKVRRLGVPTDLIERHGAVSAQVAEAMAGGMRTTSGADIALAVTGIAGPDGGTPAKPVGLVYMALAGANGVHSEELRLAGDRIQIRDRAAKYALNMLRLCLEE